MLARDLIVMASSEDVCKRWIAKLKKRAQMNAAASSALPRYVSIYTIFTPISFSISSFGRRDSIGGRRSIRVNTVYVFDFEWVAFGFANFVIFFNV